MGRREQRAELRSTWMVLETREPGVPFRRKDIVDADARLDAERAAARNVVVVDKLLAVAPDLGRSVPIDVTTSRRTYLTALAAVARTQSTVTLSRTEDVSRFEARPHPVGPAELEMMFGAHAPDVAEMLASTGARPGVATITSIDRESGTITVDGERHKSPMRE